MDNIDKNADILTILDGYKSYAAEYEERKKKQEQEEKMKKDEEDKKIAENAKKKSIQEEIAETLRKIKEQEDADAKKFEEERKAREEKKRKELEMKAKIEEELEKIRYLENIEKEKIQQREQKIAQERRERELREREEQRQRDEIEAQQKAAQKRFEEIERKRMLAEIQEKKALEAKEAARRLAKEQERRKEQLENDRRKKQAEEERLLKIKIEEEKKRLWEIEREKERKKVEEDRLARLEEDRRIAAEIIARRQAEEEQMERLKKEAEENRLRNLEIEKKKSIANRFQKQPEQEKEQRQFERPKKKSFGNPLANKFEEMARIAQKQEEESHKLLSRKKKKIQKSRDVIKKSKQILSSKEGIKKSQNLVKKRSRELIKKASLENINRSFTKLTKSKSKEFENRSQSKTNMNSSSTTLNTKETNVNKKQMQNYLISQVLFDGKEDVRTSRMIATAKPIDELQEDEDQNRKKEEENKIKELEMVKKEQEMKRQIQEELNKIKRFDEEQRIKQQEAQFEAYKNEMEKYLEFVCEEKSQASTKKKLKAKKTITEKKPTEKLTLNIGNIKSQFENESFSPDKNIPDIKSAPPQVGKLNTTKIFSESRNEDVKQKKKEYVPIIIDKDAFERTAKMFEKEKREKEDQQKNEIRIQKRRREMEAERKRLVEEKQKREQQERERIQKEEEEERLRKERKEKEREEAKYIEIKEEARQREIREQAKAAVVPEVDIFTKIQHELAKIKEEDEKMKVKIEKERKRKELQRQIQEEIDRIRTDNTQQENKSDYTFDFDDTPEWVKMIMKSQSKEEIDSKSLDTSPLATTVASSNQSDSPESEDKPAWIKIFQERSANLEAMKKESELKEKKKTEKKSNILEDKSTKNNQSIEKSKTLAEFDFDLKISKNESLVQKSVSSVKCQFESQGKETEIIEVKKRTGTQKVTDRVRKVKSLLLDGGNSNKIEKEINKKRVATAKADKIKGFFEQRNSEEKTEIPKAPHRPKKKLVKLPMVQAEENNTKPPLVEWKWKQKDVSELYNIINKNRSHIPDKLAQKASSTITSISSNIEENEQNIELDVNEYETYMETVYKYVDEKDTDETESCFKDTIKAYMDLIDEAPKTEGKGKSRAKPKSFSVNTAAVKEILEGNNRTEHFKVSRDISVGRIDTTIFSKDKEEEKKPTRPVSHDNIKNMKMKYEELNAEEGPKELYSMKRKLMPSQPDIDTNVWKKKQVEHQWKYKQKGIEELHKFIESKTNQSIVEESVEKKEYFPYFKNIDFKARVEDEERKMEEFEKFMEEIHDYLESDTKDEEESAFKWELHSYIDFVEENKDDIEIRYEKKTQRIIPENIPKVNDRKAKLKENQNTKKCDEIVNVGRLNVSSYLKNTEEKETKPQSTATIGGELTAKQKSIFETKKKDDDDWKRTIVKKKLIDITVVCDTPVENDKKKTKDWKYKKKNIAELQEFIRKNDDIASKELLKANNKLPQVKNDLSGDILRKSDQMKNQIVDKDLEFDEFLRELDHFMKDTSKTDEENDAKKNIKGYLDLIVPAATKEESALPTIGPVRNINDIRSKLLQERESQESKADNSKLIGKVSHFFKKNTKEKVDSSVLKENITSLLQPGKAKILSKSFEEKPKMTRCNSLMEIPRSKLKKFTQKDQKNDIIPPTESKPQKTWKYKQEQHSNKLKPKMSLNPELVQRPKFKSEWDAYTDPIEKQNAILAKHGLKPVRSKDDSDSDIEDILNYENKDDMAKYEKDLKQRYLLLDSDSSSRGSSPDRKTNRKGSFSSLLNIFSAMKKSVASKNFAESKSRAEMLGQGRVGRQSRSEVDLTELTASCTDVRNLFETGEAFQSDRRASLLIDEEEIKAGNAAEKPAIWKNLMSSQQSGSSNRSINREQGMRDAVPNLTELFEAGKLNEQAIRTYIDARSETAEQSSKMFSRVKTMFETGAVVRTEEGEEGRGGGVAAELEELRQSARLQDRFRLERGDQTNKPGLRRTNSCIGVTGERLPDDLDEETIAEVSVTNKMVKAMFEQNAPKYKFGGSGSSLNIDSKSKENLNKPGPVMRPSAKPKEERKWVLDSINKYFDVIVEEEEESGDDDIESDEEYSTSEEDYLDESEYDTDEVENDIVGAVQQDSAEAFQSTSRMRGMLNSVVSNISGSVGNLARKEIINNLKQNLGSQINLKSNSNLSKL